MNEIPTKTPGPWNNWDDGTEHSLRQHRVGRMIIEEQPIGYLQLSAELASGYHGSLIKKLTGTPQGETEELLAKIAVHCNVILDGTYTIQERSKLAQELVRRLQYLREPFFTPLD